MRVQIKPDLLRWACERSRIDEVALRGRFRHLDEWERGEKEPTFKQLEAFAKATHVAFGDLFLEAPPQERLPIADFRAGEKLKHRPPSGDLLDTIYAQQRRQDWFREHATMERLEPVDWIGSAAVSTAPAKIAATLRQRLGFEPDARRTSRNWVEATRLLASKLEAVGVLVATNGVVGANTRRPLDPDEFRGFSLADDRAPLMFVNGADHKASQAFTLCHELAHLALGQTGLSDEDPGELRSERVERWCDDVASEILVPLARVERSRGEDAARGQATALSRDLRVSPLVAMRRVAERSELSASTFRRCYQTMFEELPRPSAAGGGNFYALALTRVGRRFAEQVVLSTLEGNTTYAEAFRLLGVRGAGAFDELSRRVGATH